MSKFVANTADDSEAASLALSALLEQLNPTRLTEAERIASLQQYSGAGYDDDPAFHIWFDAARTSATSGRWIETEYLALRAILAHPQNTPVFPLLAQALEQNGRPDEYDIARRYRVPTSLIERYLGMEGPDALATPVPTQDTPVPTVPHESIPCVKLHWAYTAERVEIPQPVQLAPRRIRDLDTTIVDAPDAATVEIEDGQLWFDDFNTIVSDARLRRLPTLCQGHVELVSRAQRRTEPVVALGPVCLLGNRSATNYYHWMNDVLPRLEVLSASGIALDSIRSFVVQRPSQAFQRETLGHFGIYDDRILDPGRGLFLKTERLYVPVYGSNAFSLRHGRWLPEFLRREFGPPPELTVSRRLYVSRGTHGPRAVRNEGELLSLLEPYGFECVSAEAMSVREQGALFGSADVVIGPHGAGFTNTVFCKPGARIIEFYADFITACFWVQSHLSGFRHGILHVEKELRDVAQHDGSIRERRKANRLAPVVVDGDALLMLLERMGVDPL